MMTSCSVSSGVMARMLPIVMVWMETAIGLSDTMKRPRPKNAVKMSPMIVSTLRPERSDRNSIAVAASPPARNAPSANGRPSMYAPATPGTTEWESASPISDQPFSMR